MISAKDLRDVASTLNAVYAEDEPILREGLQSTLGKLFKNLFVATNGQEAFEIFKKEDIDLIITDINMPIMDGIQLIKSVRQYTEKEPSVVVISAHDESKLLTTLINMGINSFINKPVDKQQMTNLLYKTCMALNDRKLVVEYEKKLEEDLEIISRKNEILEQKIKQFAQEVNKNKKPKVNQKYLKKELVNDNYYNTLLIDDKDELRDLSMELENYIAMLFQNDVLHNDYLEKLSDSYKKYASVLNSYSEFYEVALFLNEFSETILLLEEKFMEDLHETGILFESLQVTLDNFRLNVWDKEAKDPRFYNASLNMDIKLIIDYLQGNEAEGNEVEFF